MNRSILTLFVVASLFTFLACSRSKNATDTKNIQQQWMLETLPGATYEELASAKTNINLVDMQNAGADAGCNKISFTVKEGSNNAISFTSLIITNAACVTTAKLEASLMGALELIKSYSITGNQIVFRDADGRALITAEAAGLR
ncbi:MAG: META domain-containing protein [Niabella sp.]